MTVPDEGIFPRAARGPIGLAPYGDRAETTGPPVIITIPDVYRPFLATDARSILVTLIPNHFNFIPNPAFRSSTAGWEFTGLAPAADAYSWQILAGDQSAAETAILGGSTSASVEPDPSTVDPYANGQIVAVVQDFTDYTLVGYRIIDGDAFRDWDPATDMFYDEDSWVGQSLQVNGSGNMRYRAGTNKFVYVGPQESALEATTYVEYGSAEWTFSVYARGSGRVRLKMDAYFPSDYASVDSGPQYQDLTTVADPFIEPAGDPAILGPEGHVWTLIDPAPSEAPYYESMDRGPAFETVESSWEDIEDDGRWHRVVLTTRARVEEGEGLASFAGAWWIDTQIEFDSADDLLLSAVMLDPTEYPECAYFDGGIAEDPNIDDFIWQGDADNSISLYYFDRQLRTRWLWERMNYVVPAGRPYQIFFGAYDRPYIPPEGVEPSPV